MIPATTMLADWPTMAATKWVFEFDGKVVYMK